MYNKHIDNWNDYAKANYRNVGFNSYYAYDEQKIIVISSILPKIIQ